MSSPKLAIVVVRWQGGDEVARCLESILDDTTGLGCDIKLVDSGSNDGGAEQLAQAFPRVDVIALAENHSFATAVHRGIDLSPAEMVYILNPDTELSPGSTAELLSFLETKPKAVGAVPLLINPDGSPQHRWQLRRLPSLWNLALGRPGSALSTKAPVLPRQIPQPAAAAWMIRRQAWNALNGLDPEFAPAWWEDVDFCQRMHGWLDSPDCPFDSSLWVVPESRVLHIGSSSLAHLDRESFCSMYYRNFGLFVRRHHPRWVGLAIFCAKTSLRLRAITNRQARPAMRAAIAAID